MKNVNLNEEDIKANRRSKISFLLISFNSGISTISDLGVKYYLKNIKKVETTKFTSILLILKIPFLLKPLLGLFTDFFPMCGYKRKSYLYICFSISIIFWSVFICSISDDLTRAIICLFLINISLSFTTVLGQAIQVEINLENKNNINGDITDLLSLHFIVKTIGVLLSSLFEGYLIETFDLDIIFYVSAFIPFLILFSAIILDERKITDNENMYNFTNTNLIIYNNINIEKELRRRYSHLSIKSQSEEIKILMKTKNIIKLLFIIIILEASPVFFSPLFYYEADVLKLKPKDFGVIDLFSQISIILFILIYQNLCYKLGFKSIICFVKVLIFITFTFLYLLIMKYTQKYIKDFPLLVLIMSLYSGLNSLGKLPYSLLSVLFSPKDLAATTNSLFVCGCYLGNIFADYFEYLLSDYFKVSHNNFINFGQLVLTVNFLGLIPLFVVCLFPNSFFTHSTTQNKNVQKLKENDNTEDSESMEKYKEELVFELDN